MAGNLASGSSPSLVAIDLGAESCRVSLLTMQGEKPEVRLVHRFANAPVARGEALFWDLDRILSEIEQGLLRCDSCADQPLSELEAYRRVPLRIAAQVRAAQLAAALVEQIDGERFERNQPRDESRDLLEEVVESEDAGDLPAQVEERRYELALALGFRCPGRRCVVCGMSWTH